MWGNHPSCYRLGHEKSTFLKHADDLRNMDNNLLLVQILKQYVEEDLVGFGILLSLTRMIKRIQLLFKVFIHLNLTRIHFLAVKRKLFLVLLVSITVNYSHLLKLLSGFMLMDLRTNYQQKKLFKVKDLDNMSKTSSN